tara:strand:- start:3207 stop:5507 length:2301 start_codon:yes stop_codon:yes gene_type:complete
MEARAEPPPVALGKRVARDANDQGGAADHDAAQKAARGPLVKEVETTNTTTTTERHYALPPETHTAPEAAAEEAPVEAQAPQLSGGSHGRSREEFAMAAYALHCLGLPCERDDVLRSIQLGDDNGRVDVAIQLPDGPLLLLEWDGGVWHGADRLEGDVRKTKRMLAIDNAIVVRVRVGQAAPFPPMQGVVVVHVPTAHPAKAIQALASALTPKLPTDHAKVFAQRANGCRVTGVEDAIDAAWCSVDAAYARQQEEVVKLMESKEVADKLFKRNGVRTRLPAVKATVKEFVARGLTLDTIARFPHSFWAAIETDGLRIGIDSMLERGLAVERLHSMGDSFYSALVNHPVKLADGIDSMLERGLAVERLHNMGGSFYSALVNHPVKLADGIEAILGRGLAVERLHNMGDSFYSALVKHPVKLAEGIEAILGRGLAVERLHSMGDSFFSALVNHPVKLTNGIEAILGRGLAVERLSNMGNSFYSALVNHPVELAEGIEAILGRGLAVERLASMGGSFYSALVNHPVKLADGIEAMLARGLAVERLHNMGSSFYSALVNHPVKLTEGIEAILGRGLAVERLHNMGGSFYSALVNHPVKLTEGIEAMLGRGLAVERLATMGDSFYSALVKHPVKLTEGIEWLLNRGFQMERLANSGNPFWSGLASDKSTAVKDTLELLMDEYGFGEDSICSLDKTFWGNVKKEGEFDELRSYLATLATPGHVNKHIETLNRDRKFGRGARVCKHARPKLVHEKAVVAKATTQTSLMGFFGK